MRAEVFTSMLCMLCSTSFRRAANKQIIYRIKTPDFTQEEHAMTPSAAGPCQSSIRNKAAW